MPRRARGIASGFNTGIDFEGALFHVQTEVRKESGIETCVCVKGAVVHSVKILRPGPILAAAAGGHELARLLEGQGRQAIARIRASQIKPFFAPATGPDLLET